MIKFFSPDEKPSGYKLKDMPSINRQDVVKREPMIAGGNRPELCQVMAKNMRILEKPTDCIELEVYTTRTLDPTFGQSGAEPWFGAA
jgi:hypothetical protein